MDPHVGITRHHVTGMSLWSKGCFHQCLRKGVAELNRIQRQVSWAALSAPRWFVRSRYTLPVSHNTRPSLVVSTGIIEQQLRRVSPCAEFLVLPSAQQS